MQKISSYLYSNRIQVLADVTALDAQYPVEWKIVYQRNVKIYKGVDNVIELDVKNSDQKRININGKNIKFVVMDQTNKEISTYTATILDDGSSTSTKGLAKVTIPQADVANLNPQYLKFSIYQLNVDTTKTLIYGDTKFGGHGTIELLNGIIPETRETRHYDTFQAETNYNGNTMQDRTVNYYSSAVPVKFYEAEPTTTADVTVNVTGFVGTIKIQATKKDVIGHESFLNTTIQTIEYTTPRSTPVVFSDIDTTDITYLRVGYIKTAGTVDSFDVVS